jgi:hypothetical protein
MPGNLMLRHEVYVHRYHVFTEYLRSDFLKIAEAQQHLGILSYLLDSIKLCPKLNSCVEVRLCYIHISTRTSNAIPSQLTFYSRLLLPYSIECLKNICTF